MTYLDNQIGNLNDIRSSCDRAMNILLKAKKAMKGKRFVMLVNPEFPKAVFEIGETKYNDNPKHYKDYRLVGKGIWK